MTARTRLVIIFGGRSEEHKVSIVSARSLITAIDTDRYEIIPMAIDRQGLWAVPETAQRVLDESGDSIDSVIEFEGEYKLDQRLLAPGIDVVFPILHGPFGEDGTIQGLLEVLDLPYVGCGVTASAICMDKILFKRLLKGDFKMARWREITRRQWPAEREYLEHQCLELGLPLFVKPSCLGSSVGISKVESREELAPAIEKAFEFDDDILVEEGIAGREIEVAVLGNSSPRASQPGEIVPGSSFYDFDDKYAGASTSDLRIPAPLSEDLRDRIQEIAIAVFSHIGCTGMARVDFFIGQDETIWVNEINTIPGFTPISMYPKLWSISGLSYADLIDELVRLARE